MLLSTQIGIIKVNYIVQCAFDNHKKKLHKFQKLILKKPTILTPHANSGVRIFEFVMRISQRNHIRIRNLLTRLLGFPVVIDYFAIAVRIFHHSRPTVC